ncbi:hypothetical protein C8R43DRAFT_1049854 [Mycena crocata]|nr:hypothetical protein C8R43DRAFT_1049854 [Mycena crocata]
MPALFPVDKVLGVDLIGLALSTIIYGITCLQVFLYYTKYCSRDSLALKLFVAGLMIMDTVEWSLLVVAMYHYTITNFGDYIVLQRNHWSLSYQAVLGGLLAVLVEMFFAWRLFNLSGRKLIFPFVIGIFCLAKTATSIGFTYVSDVSAKEFSQAGILEVWSLVSLATAIACDAFIAFGLIYYLHRGNAGFKGTHRAINLLITYALNTCLLTSIFNAVCMAMWITESSTLLYSLFYNLIVRLYSCSFMSTLNSRETVRNEMHTGELITMSHLVAHPSEQTQSGPVKFNPGPTGSTVTAWDDGIESQTTHKH